MRALFKSTPSPAKTKGWLKQAHVFATSPSRREERYSRGFTLIEIGIVLTMIGLLTAVIWVAGAAVSENNGVNRATQQVVQVVQNIRDQYANTQSPSTWTVGSDITGTLLSLQLFPAEMGPAVPLTHALSGKFQVTQPSSATGADPNATKTPACGTGVTCFRIVLNGLSQSGCVKLAEAIPVTDTALGIVQIGVAVGATTNMQTCTGTPCLFTKPLPIKGANGVASWCDGTTNDNSVFVDYKLHN